MKTFINTALLKEQLKRFWLIAAITMLWYLIFIVQPIYLNTSNVSYGRASASMVRLLIMNFNPIIMAMVAVPFCAAMALFSYSFKTAATTAYHSLPINRKQLFFTNGITGFVLMLVPLMVLSLILLIPVRFVEFSVSHWLVDTLAPGVTHGDVINTLPRVAGFFARAALGFTMYFAVFILAVSLAGSFVTSVLLIGAIVITPLAVVGLFSIIGEFYVFGYMVPFFNFTTVAALFQPIFWSSAFGVAVGFSGGTRPLSHLYLSYGLITVAALGLSYVAYRIRPQERAGDAVVFTPLKRVLIFLVALAGMFFMGIVGLLTVGSRIGLYIGFVPGFPIAYFIAQMLAEKTFRVGNKAKGLVPYGAVAVALYVLLLGVTRVGLWGYVRHVPQNQEITGVHISHNWGLHGWVWGHPLFIYDSATIARVQEIHQGIIGERRYLQREQWRNVGRWDMPPFTVTYRLSNGRYVTRGYLVTPDFRERWAINELMQSDPVVLAGFRSLSTPERINHIEAIVRNEEYWDAMDGVTRIAAEARDIHAGDYAQDIIYRRHRIIISETPQIIELAEAIQSDILFVARGRGQADWRNHIAIFVDIRREYDMYTSGFWTMVPVEGHTADWLMVNSDLADVLG